MGEPAAVNVLCIEALKINPITFNTLYGYIFQKSLNLELWRYQNKRLKWYYEKNKIDHLSVLDVILSLIPQLISIGIKDISLEILLLIS